MKLYLLRHAERGHGKKQDTLVKEGVKQSNLIINSLSKLGIEKIYCSDSKRTKKTIEPFLKNFNGEVIYTDEINELRMGVLEGKSGKEYNEMLEKSGLSKEDFRPPKGENFEDFRNRVKKFIESLKDEKKEKVLLVTHGGVIRNFIKSLINLPPEEISKIDFVSLTTFEIDGDFQVISYSLNEKII